MQSSGLLRYHSLFLVIGLIFGIWLAFVNPPWHANDEDRHFYNAYNLSTGNLGPQSNGKDCGFILPVELVKEVINFQGIKIDEKKKIRQSLYKDLEKNTLEAEKDTFLATPSCKLMPFAYIPSALMIKVGGAIQSSPIWLCWWGRIGSLLAYLLITFYAIKTIPVFKPLLMMVALSPMALYQGASVSYDGLSMAFLFLFFALLIRMYTQDGLIDKKQIALLFLVALAQHFAKNGYFLMYFSVVFIPIKKFEHRGWYIGAILLMIIAWYIPSPLWNWYLNAQNLPAELPLQKDYLFDTVKNLSVIRQHPFQFMQLLADNILSQGEWILYGSIGRFGYSYLQLPEIVILVYIAGYMFVVLSEKRPYTFHPAFRMPILGLALLNALGILVIFFLSITPVGGHFIQGIQGRYFTPFFPFIFAFLFYIPQPPLFKDRLNWFVPVFTTIMLIYTVHFLEGHFYNTP